jgi:hypothetical protein
MLGHGQHGNGNSPYSLRIVKQGGVTATSVGPGETIGSKFADETENFFFHLIFFFS